jgi:hypothetical protein
MIHPSMRSDCGRLARGIGAVMEDRVRAAARDRNWSKLAMTGPNQFPIRGQRSSSVEVLNFAGFLN